MRSIAYYWKEGLRNIFKHGFMSVAAVVIMVVSLLLTGTVTLVAYNITNNITRLQQSNQIVVWIDDSLTTREAKTLQTQFEKIDNIASIAFEDRDVALEQYRKELGDDADILEDYNADNNPLRNSYVFTLSDSMQADATIKEIEAVDGVASVRADEDVIRKLVQIQRVFNMIAAAMIVGLAVISIFIISNTVKLAMFARREEISIQKMVGATNWFIRWPFVIEAWCSVWLPADWPSSRNGVCTPSCTTWQVRCRCLRSICSRSMCCAGGCSACTAVQARCSASAAR
ncbi:ABC transporter permease [Butyricicoccus sp. OM06-6AC]|nr:permease-like cell division protein FtsX [Butyricicoccus sp. OM06-6AC]RGM79744.1 ABC transporter permease [Butyricicoccus sp. OM06-6AC]